LTLGGHCDHRCALSGSNGHVNRLDERPFFED
jgi:hypothetical protein